MSWRAMQLVGGHLAFAAIASRGSLSLLDSVYKFSTTHLLDATAGAQSFRRFAAFCVVPIDR